MKIEMDKQQYRLSLEKVTYGVRALYHAASTSGIQLKDGRMFVFNKGSLMRATLKVLMTPIFIPILKDIYKDRGLTLDPPVPHSDLIDYFINGLLNWVLLVEGNLHVSLSSIETDNDSCKTIVSAIASWKTTPKIDSGSNDREETSTQDTGGETLVRSGQNGHGQDTTD